MSQTISLMIADNLQLLRECLAAVLSGQEGIAIVGQAASQAEAIAQAKLLRPDVVLIGINLPDNSALELTCQISLELPQPRLIILGVPEDEQTILRFIEAGASGYVLKEGSLEDLIEVIQAVHRGEVLCSPRIAYSMFSRVAELAYTSRSLSRIEADTLTRREGEILQLIANGFSNKQIAERLFISLYTVKNHVHNILDKLQVHHRSEAVHYAFGKGILKTGQSTAEI